MNNAEGFYIGPPQSPATPEGGAKEAQPNQSPSKLVGSGSSGSVSVEQRNRIGSIYVEDGGARGDNLAIVLASYFSRHMDRPEDDEDHPDFGWGKWVIEKLNRALELIAAESSQNT